MFGSVRLDLREAVLPGPEVDIEAKAVFGSVEVMVPEGVVVEVSGGGALSSQEVRVGGLTPDGAPVIRIHHRGVLRLAQRPQPAAAHGPAQGRRPPAGRAAQPAARMKCWGP